MTWRRSSTPRRSRQRGRPYGCSTRTQPPRRRRVVVVADVPDGLVQIRDDLDRGVVRVSAPVPMRQVASAHVDDSAAEAAVAAAAAVAIEADLGDATAQDALDDAEGFELNWYASQEIAPLLDLL